MQYKKIVTITLKQEIFEPDYDGYNMSEEYYYDDGEY